MNTKFSVSALSFAATLLIGSIANAGNLGQFDARSLAMGGAGVAGAQSANAAAYNPALMATEANKKNFSIIPLVVKIEAYDENSFIDTIEDAEESINGDDGLDQLLDDMGELTETTCGGDPCYVNANMVPVSAKSLEAKGHIVNLNESNALVNANTGIAVQFGKKIPMAFIIDGGLSTRLGVKFANSDFNELTLYADVMSDGEISTDDVSALGDLVNVDTSGGPGNTKIEFVRGSDSAQELESLLEVTGASYYEFGVSFADSFRYLDKDLSVGITPKVVNVKTIKYHQSVEAEDVETDDILDDDNITSKTDFNTDVGIVFKPLDSQPLQVGVTIKNLFTRSFELKKTPQEIAIETAAASGDPDAQADLKAFKFTQTLKIEPQITAGIAYDLRFFNLLADIDLNAAEVLGQTTQHLSLGAEFDARVIKVQAGYRTSIGGDDEEDALSAGLSLGPVALAAVFSNDNIGGVIQAGFSF